MHSKTDREEAVNIDGDALQQLYQMYQKPIYLYLYAMCHNPAVAEDLTQDTFVKALLSLPKDHANVKAWLYMVARNLYLNYRKREKQKISWDEDGIPVLGTPVALGLPVPEPKINDKQ